MKRIALIVTIGAIGTLFLSSYCTTESEQVIAKSEINAHMPEQEVKAGAGIDFKKLTLEKAMKEAGDKGKLIFIDAYTSWCGPCKQMAATSFMDTEVGDVFNENFVNIKIDIEKDADGPEVAKAYNVRAYPTLLIIDSEGNLVKQVIGFQTKDRLLALAESVL